MSECRICLGIRRNARSIFDSTDRSISTTYADMITYIASVKITRDDGITDQICLACRKKLRELYDFKLLILWSNTQLHQKNNSHLKRIHFNDIADVKLEIATAPIDNKYLLKEFEDIKMNLRSAEDSICYKDTIIKKVDPTPVEVELDNQPMSVMDFLDTIKGDLEDDFGQDFDEAHGPSDSDEYLPLCDFNKRYGKKQKKKKKLKMAKSTKNGNVKTDAATKKVCIKPTWIDDLRVMATYEPKSTPTEKKKYKHRSKEEMCPYCGKITKNLSSHLILHGEPRYKCSEEGCGRVFHHRTALLKHALTHGARSFQCDQCVAAFHTLQSLRQHKNSHDQTRRFVCETCSKSYKRAHQLSRHVRTHNSANKSHACELCNMSFFSTYGLRHHMRVHTGERPYNCELCSQPYSYKHDFNRHCLKKHGIFLKRRSVNVMNAEVSKTCVLIVVCVGLFIAIQTLVPKAAAKRTDVDEYTVENRRTDLRHDYVLGFIDEPSDEYGPKYEVPPAAEGALPDFIVDYANMIRNDIILLDNSVQTRTRKRGNIKLNKHAYESNLDFPCSCERNDVPKEVNLSEVWDADAFPERVLNLTCDDRRCAKPHGCRRIQYNLTVLKNTNSEDERNSAGELYKNLHNDLKHKWVPKVVSVVTGCVCAASYVSN